MLKFLKTQCQSIDNKTLNLLAMCKIAIREPKTQILKSYLKRGDLITYNFDKKMLKSELIKTQAEEIAETKNGTLRPKFIALFLDFKKQRIK